MGVRLWIVSRAQILDTSVRGFYLGDSAFRKLGPGFRAKRAPTERRRMGLSSQIRSSVGRNNVLGCALCKPFQERAMPHIPSSTARVAGPSVRSRPSPVDVGVVAFMDGGAAG